MLGLLLRVQDYWHDVAAGLAERSWNGESRFSKLRQEIDKIALQDEDTLRPNLDTLRTLVREKKIEGVLCALVWHICIVALNHPFVALRLARDQQMLWANAMPRAFLEERVNVCLTGAKSISNICEEITLNNGFFCSPVM
ncbi:hypothetical protein H2198_002297, partial [Neophaeococcomyces mojaviensis]